MSKIQILDCTLRDGGYVNDFLFGNNNIKKIIFQLQNAKIDIVECGFLEDGKYNPDCSVFNTTDQIRNVLPSERSTDTMFVAMACYGEYDLQQLSPYDGTSIEGIRVTFHYNEVDGALGYCRKIQSLGYKVFVQPVGTTSYTDEQLINLIKKVNELNPHAFYLVDTLGLMQKDDVARLFYLIDHNLDKHIHMGFHSHNNLQLSYSNCQYLSSIVTDRTISLDSSVYGMGRGAGNLNTELIATYLNNYNGGTYLIEPLLEIVDEHIAKIKERHEWGYSVPYYLAAINGCHPNYASFLNGKQTLTVKQIGAILRMIEKDKRSLFDRNLAEKIYKEFQDIEIDDTKAIEYLRSFLRDKLILILAPGTSIKDNIKDILDWKSQKNAIVISVGFVPDFIAPDYVFLTNSKRYETTFNPQKKSINLIYSSNIHIEKIDGIKVNYQSLLYSNDNEVIDNSSLMLLKLLQRIGISKVDIAGMDGYESNQVNYYEDRLKMNYGQAIDFNLLNNAISKALNHFQKSMEISFLTPTNYNIDKN